ncbi:hypothetical protein M5D96_010828, partial [Drosophila gunungcola]
PVSYVQLTYFHRIGEISSKSTSTKAKCGRLHATSHRNWFLQFPDNLGDGYTTQNNSGPTHNTPILAGQKPPVAASAWFFCLAPKQK